MSIIKTENAKCSQMLHINHRRANLNTSRDLPIACDLESSNGGEGKIIIVNKRLADASGDGQETPTQILSFDQRGLTSFA